MNLSPCGIDCDACPLKEKCGNGCQVSCGRPFYIKNFGVECCPIYDCSVNTKGYKTCGECPDLPCQIFFDWKDPSMSDKEHNEAVNANVALLKSLQQGAALITGCTAKIENQVCCLILPSIDSDNGIIWHNGGTGDYNSYLGFNPVNQIAVVILSNLPPGYRIPATVMGVKLLVELQREAD